MKLTDKQVIDALEATGSIPEAAKKLKANYDTIQKRVNRMRKRGQLEADLRSDRARPRRWVVTSAQDSTSIDTRFFESLKCYCHHNDAQLCVIPVKYENITLTQKYGKHERWWSAELVPYLCNNRICINDNLMLMGDITVNATNKNPLSGFETITGKRSGIFGHSQLEMKVVPTPLSKLPKKLQTTGTVTLPNYSDTKAGKIAEDNHCVGALVVDVRGDQFWIRQVRADKDGSFHDLDTVYTPTGIKPAKPPLGLVCGDIHWDHICPQVLRATFTSETSIVKALDPQQVVIHDVFDGYAGSHHHQKDPLLQFYKHHHKTNDVRAELDRLIQGIKIMAKRPLKFVDSNHNRHLSRWLNECDPKKDHENAEIYYELRLAQVRQAKAAKDPREIMDPLEWYIRQRIKTIDMEFISHDSGHHLGKYDISNHGDIGANGTRGSAQQFTKFGGYYILGHSHTPGVYKNVLQTGTSTRLDMEYVTGPSSWLNSHVLVYANGLATHLDVIGGRWRA